MNIIHRRGWEIPESQAAPEHLFMNRRALLRGVAALAGAALDFESQLRRGRRSDRGPLSREAQRKIQTRP